MCEISAWQCHTSVFSSIPVFMWSTVKRILSAGIKQKTLVTPQVKMVLPSQDTLRQKLSQLRKVIPQVNNKHNNSNDDDAKKSSMLLDFPKTDPQRTSASGTRGSGSGSFIPPRPSGRSVQEIFCCNNDDKVDNNQLSFPDLTEGCLHLSRCWYQPSELSV